MAWVAMRFECCALPPQYYQYNSMLRLKQVHDHGHTINLPFSLICCFNLTRTSGINGFVCVHHATVVCPDSRTSKLWKTGAATDATAAAADGYSGCRCKSKHSIKNAWEFARRHCGLFFIDNPFAEKTKNSFAHTQRTHIVDWNRLLLLQHHHSRKYKGEEFNST